MYVFAVDVRSDLTGQSGAQSDIQAVLSTGAAITQQRQLSFAGAADGETHFHTDHHHQVLPHQRSLD